MSFILDALKKSEIDRQHQRSAEFAAVPTGGDGRRVPGWLWAFGLLLAINLAVLLGFLLRPGVEQPTLSPEPVAEITPPSVEEPSFAEQVADAKQQLPVRQDPVMVAEPVTAAAVPTTPAQVRSAAPRNPASLPTIFEVRANGTVELPDLHLDIHVYSDTPADRFVFINMSKQRENTTLSEGPVVDEITPDGVVLEYRGTLFLLPRD